MANWQKPKGKGPNVDKGSGSKAGAHDSESVGRVDKEEDGGKQRGDHPGGEGRQHDVEFAKGGDTKMFGEQAAGDQKPGGTAHDVTGGAPGADFAKGGSGKMFGFAGAQPARAGITSAR